MGRIVTRTKRWWINRQSAQPTLELLDFGLETPGIEPGTRATMEQSRLLKVTAM